MSLTIDVSEVRAFARSMTTYNQRLGAPASAAFRRTVLAIEADAAVSAPYDLGNLRNSMSSTITGDGRGGQMTAEVGPTAEYGIYQEFGTSTHGAQPYLGPAFDRQTPGLDTALAQIAARAI